MAQVREFRAQRRESVALELVRSFYSPDLAKAVHQIRQLPDGLSAEEMRSRGPEYELAAVAISTTFESIAYLVFRRMASFEMVRDLMGGIALVLWHKLERWMEDCRVEQSQPSWGEWFQWLAEQLAREAELKESQPAYRHHADWRPAD